MGFYLRSENGLTQNTGKWRLAIHRKLQEKIPAAKPHDIQDFNIHLKIPWAVGRGIRKSSGVVMRAEMEGEGWKVSPNEPRGRIFNPTGRRPVGFPFPFVV